MFFRFVFSIALLFFFVNDSQALNSKKAEFRIVNKITTRVDVVKVEEGDNYKFDGLELSLMSCLKSYGENPSKALIKIYNTKSDGEDVVFSGWTLSSSPAVSMLEHPLYNVILIKCV